MASLYIGDRKTFTYCTNRNSVILQSMLDKEKVGMYVDICLACFERLVLLCVIVNFSYMS